MLRLGADGDLRRRLGSRGLRRFEERFSLYSFGRQTEHFYREVLEEWRGRYGSQPAPGNRYASRGDRKLRGRLGPEHEGRLMVRQPA